MSEKQNWMSKCGARCAIMKNICTVIDTLYTMCMHAYMSDRLLSQKAFAIGL